MNPALTVLDVTARNGLIYEDIEIGTGRNIFPGDSVREIILVDELRTRG